ncbi:hypothetical protein, partial [Gemmiger formicilis]|uniref:hypothetical protein n=1 Tax=Gemmiger formicilis TaxID=745368 RepID=UPI002431E16F
IICAFGLAAAAPRSPYRHLELCGIAIRISVVVCTAATFLWYTGIKRGRFDGCFSKYGAVF